MSVEYQEARVRQIILNLRSQVAALTTEITQISSKVPTDAVTAYEKLQNIFYPLLEEVVSIAKRIESLGDDYDITDLEMEYQNDALADALALELELFRRIINIEDSIGIDILRKEQE